MIDERLPNVSFISWAFASLIGQLVEWTPKLPVRNVTASGNANPLDGLVRADATSGAITLTLETAVGCVGRMHNFKKIDASANTVTIDGAGSETIDGATTLVISTQYVSYQIVSNGSGWDII